MLQSHVGESLYHNHYTFLTYEADKKRNAFDTARLVNRCIKLNPNEQYAVYEVDVTGEETDIAEESANRDIDVDILNYDDIDDPEALA